MPYTPYRSADAVGPDDDASERRGAILGLVLDVGLPLTGYYLLHGLGASDWVALMVATAAAGLRLIAAAVWNRRVSWFAAVMLGVFGVGLGLAFIGGDARFLLLKDSVTTTVLGSVFLASLAGDHPLTLDGAQAWRPRRAEELVQLYRSEPAARRAFRVSTLGWGLGLLGEAISRIPVIYLLPVDVAVGVSTVWMILAIALIAGWNAVYIARAARRTPALALLIPGGPRPRRKDSHP